jgi:hypothetical protein
LGTTGQLLTIYIDATIDEDMGITLPIIYERYSKGLIETSQNAHTQPHYTGEGEAEPQSMMEQQNWQQLL